MSLTDKLFERNGRDAMRAIEVGEDHSISVIAVAVPTPAPGEVIVSPVCCGICGTDLHIVRHGFPGTRYPVIPGHEFAGHVTAVGSDVRDIKEGDFVAVDPNGTCGTCRWCKAGRPNLCLNLFPLGVARPGAFADFVAVPARNAYRVPESIGHSVAALIEPLACVLNAVAASGGVKDRTVLVMGAGTMGLLLAVVCRKLEAASVTVCDPAVGKHAVARKAGIENVAMPDGLGSSLFEVVFEAAGVAPALVAGVGRLDATGTLVQVGVHNEEDRVGLPPFLIYEKELRIVGSNSLADKFPAAVEFMPDIRDEASALVTDTYSAWDFAAAVDNMAKGASVKTLLTFPGPSR
ncbi:MULTISPECIES: alcohol dehydrogenase catalytic domain-containing protein [unclassified Aureimonas]|uniref:alcohol dehydrogenase catalytic domain-containing protein n=1 Tax=unclassified Aureimonas TaxID=2615206 RepID=UPI0006F9A098|nr:MULTISPECIES: alcohol dehydrogenase catalytic domain-containing protein [unclassified Aureimonas]KQT63309.1 alcohol dehydrogenase [Aureimonas sp. Leaf427]KQT80111.1 alcohol dehydrogenase [Aureimonas sp. Leaf460]